MRSQWTISSSTLIDLQALDTRIAGARGRRRAAARGDRRHPRRRRRSQAGRRDGQGAARRRPKEQRAKEKDLEVSQAKRAKTEARLYEVKTNKEYSAVLTEIEDIKQEKARVEEEILVLMESQERLAVEIKDAEARFKARESQGRGEEATLQEKLRAVEAELGGVRAERKELAGRLPAPVLADYDKLLRARGGLALVPGEPSRTSCGGCRVTITPQRLQELRAQNRAHPLRVLRPLPLLALVKGIFPPPSPLSSPPGERNGNPAG